jgi:hypothetical protein
LALLVWMGCGASSGNPSADAGPADGAGGGGGAAKDASSADSPSMVMLNDAGCLTFASASQVCGFQSDGSICAFSIGCNNSTNMGQCQINCEMGTTVMCYSAKDVDCLRRAEAARSCAALIACNWIL